MTSPSAVTFVRASDPDSDKWFDTARDRLRVDSGASEAFLRLHVDKPRRKVLADAELGAKSEEPAVGTWTARRVDADTGPYRRMTWNTRPADAAGSANRTAVISGAGGRVLTWDVTVDINAVLSADDERAAFKITCSSAVAQWLKTASLELTLTWVDGTVAPTDVSPSGNVGTAKPRVSWTAPVGVTKVRVLVDDSADFSSPAYDSGELTKTTAEVDTATEGPGWAGISGTMHIGVQHFTAAGWSDVVSSTVTYNPPTNFVISNPSSFDADPTPPSVWTPAAEAVRIVSYLDEKRIADTGMIPGPLTSYTPTKGAKKAGQVLKRVHHFFDGVEREQPAFVRVVTQTMYIPTPTVAGLSSLSVAQQANSPAVWVEWTRDAGVPDEVALIHGDNAELVVPGTEPAVDWTVQPNTDLFYQARAVVNRERSEDIVEFHLRTRVVGVWVVDPVSERGFVLAGKNGLDIAYGGEVVVHTPIDGAVLLRRTLTRRGIEGTISGHLSERLAAPWTIEEQLENVEWLADHPSRVVRLIMGDLNVPITHSSMQALFDPGRTRASQVHHQVSFGLSHAGDD